MEIVIGGIVLFVIWAIISASSSKKKALKLLFEAEAEIKNHEYDNWILKFIDKYSSDIEVKKHFIFYLKKAIRSQVDHMPHNIFDRLEYKRTIELIDNAIDERLFYLRKASRSKFQYSPDDVPF